MGAPVVLSKNWMLSVVRIIPVALVGLVTNALSDRLRIVGVVPLDVPDGPNHGSGVVLEELMTVGA
jgi:hypothetical protein